MYIDGISSTRKHVEGHDKAPDGHIGTQTFTDTGKLPKHTERSALVLV